MSNGRSFTGPERNLSLFCNSGYMSYPEILLLCFPHFLFPLHLWLIYNKTARNMNHKMHTIYAKIIPIHEHSCFFFFFNILLAIWGLINIVAHRVCNIFQDQSSFKRNQWESSCLLVVRWNWTDKVGRNIGESFWDTSSKLLNESGWKYMIPLVFPNPSYIQ